jgi:hypothetical protein
MELSSLFAMLTDEELAARLASGELTESASKLAAAELQSRGVDLPACECGQRICWTDFHDL